MNDTSPQMAKKMREMINAKSPSERLKMGCSMYESSKLLISQNIRRHYPNISLVEFKKKIFLKFYDNDFNSIEKEKILKHIESLGPEQTH